jgi:hypothetical protein
LLQQLNTAAADTNGDSGRQQLRMMMAAGDNGLQDQLADYDGEGRERAARDGGDSGVVMTAAAKMAAAEDSGGRQKRRWRQTMAADKDGT